MKRPLPYGTTHLFFTGLELLRRVASLVPPPKLNLTRFQRLRHVILPQAVVVMLPTFGNNAIELLKATSVVSLISLTDLTFQAQVVRSQTGSTAFPFLTILVLYFLMSGVITLLVRALERRMSRGFEGTRA